MATQADIAAIMQALATQGTALQTLLTQNQQNPSTAGGVSNLTATVSQGIAFDKFEPREEEFSKYLERFENYTRLRGLVLSSSASADQIQHINDNKRNILLARLKRMEFAELKADAPEHKPSSMSYNNLVKCLKKHYNETTNVQTERHKFLSRVQNKFESLAEYISALKLIAQCCSWTCPENNCKKENTTIFQAQFIRGIRESFIREKLLQLEASTDLN